MALTMERGDNDFFCSSAVYENLFFAKYFFDHAVEFISKGAFIGVVAGENDDALFTECSK
ncbi:hypothetical protein [Chryseolinea lacunae]|uniref:Uncharacterized protein n=1 Tax=Chryseolinea lacunae TaxID=2801331 RepID=A0ABS1KWL2_9BACT|nr:hypothetical protein [Chryseolinea lacunae]MBL0743578.1 hypothetical protein [Chryseolinea lacunae]